MRPALRLFNHHHFRITVFHIAGNIGKCRHICHRKLIGFSVNQNSDFFNTRIPRAGQHQCTHSLNAAVALFGNLGEIPTEIDGDHTVADIDAKQLHALIEGCFQPTVCFWASQKLKDSGCNVSGSIYRSGNRYKQSAVLRWKEDLNFIAVCKCRSAVFFCVQSDTRIGTADICSVRQCIARFAVN